MELPVEMFVRPVEGESDLLAFTYDFDLDAKALGDAGAVTELEDGDLLISGMAAVFDGVDREGENFAPGAFQRGIKAFIEGQAPLCFHHKRDQILGKVLELEEVEGKGLRLKARVDGAIKDHPTLGPVYHQIRKGTINALSVGGFFRRKLTEAGRRIVDMDFVEISATATPVHPGTSFAVVAGKALVADIEVPEPPKVDDQTEIRDADLQSISFLFEELDGLFRRIEDSITKRKNDTQTTLA